MSLNESIVEDAALIWFEELHYAIAQLEDAPAEWEVKTSCFCSSNWRWCALTGMVGGLLVSCKSVN